MPIMLSNSQESYKISVSDQDSTWSQKIILSSWIKTFKTTCVGLYDVKGQFNYNKHKWVPYFCSQTKDIIEKINEIKRKEAYSKR